MNPKIEITKNLLEFLGQEVTEQNIQKHIPIWFQNCRIKINSGFRLTRDGFTQMIEAGIKHYPVRYTEEIQWNNELILWADKNIDCPFFLDNRRIYVFGEKMAVQLVLFEGNIQKLYRAQMRFKQKQQIN
jgi:hypothetical protein